MITTDPALLVPALRAGRVVAIPTETVYGLAVDPRLSGATAALFRLKERPADVALPVLVPSLASARRLVESFPPAAAALAERWWPGPLTIVVGRGAGASSRWDLGGDGRSIGLRSPDSPLALELLGLVGPLVATSANRHGEPAIGTAELVEAAFGEALAAVLDGGRCEGEPSTVVIVRDGADSGRGAADRERSAIELARPGPVGIEEIRRVAATAGRR